MKVYPGVEEPKVVRKLAKAIGLTSIKTSSTYNLVKTGAKNASPYGYADEMYCERGNTYIAGNADYVFIIVTNGSGRWFKTSPVLSCTKIDGGYKLETENSFYELRK